MPCSSAVLMSDQSNTYAMFKSLLESILSSSVSRFFDQHNYHGCTLTGREVESYRAGYPRFAALVGAHHSFQMYRRFARLRTRVLLLKQDRLSMLEQQLDSVDESERSPLFLGSSRDDQNQKRTALLLEVDAALADYDDFVERSSRMLSGESAKRRDVRSLQNWIEGNGCLSWEESDFLAHCNDLRRLVPTEDDATARFEGWVEDRLGWMVQKLQKRSAYPRLSSDPKVFISTTAFVGSVARVLVVFLIIVFLSLPIIVCRSIESSSARLGVIVFSLIVFLLVLAGVVTKRTNELFLAGATYTTVLVVFVSSSDISASGVGG
ncbi:hypothetical protein BU25DRAFT_446986 [Macroventuria anomochaeta]|uniref:Uncharacterized protein n=1 Tax=Macroventuria anomochaeta TaxID=301207 RepID=A0ACB6S5G2_9PLEO|nr:uncharacterized protein BU25DRAFT_446986 [Macroventuria anomochaeta]KAF2629496.1 hypothetical protein BU25DRAFT_446986 [Macroventuria anomochaeta]